MLICIDPGHSGPHEPGAVHIATGLQESTVVLSIAKQVKSALEYVGCMVLLTRDSDIDTDDLAFRCRMANTAQADLFVSIHTNSFSEPTANGAETYHYHDSDQGRLLARYIQHSMIAATGLRDRGIKTADFYVLTQTDMPAVLVECGFLSNETDRSLCFTTEAARKRVGRSIANGIMNYVLRQDQ